MLPLKLRWGFTLIEMLIVIVVLGLLAVIALPRLTKAGERAQFRALMSDLRNLQSQQEIYAGLPGNNSTYAADVALLANFQTSPGVTISITAAGTTGWGATAAHAALAANQLCAVFAGTVSAVPAPAAAPGVVACTGER